MYLLGDVMINYIGMCFVYIWSLFDSSLIIDDGSAYASIAEG